MSDETTATGPGDLFNLARFLEAQNDDYARALSEIEPIKENPLDALAAKLKARLPALFSDVESGATIG